MIRNRIILLITLLIFSITVSSSNLFIFYVRINYETDRDDLNNKLDSIRTQLKSDDKFIGVYSNTGEIITDIDDFKSQTDERKKNESNDYFKENEDFNLLKETIDSILNTKYYVKNNKITTDSLLSNYKSLNLYTYAPKELYYENNLYKILAKIILIEGWCDKENQNDYSINIKFYNWEIAEDKSIYNSENINKYITQ